MALKRLDKLLADMGIASRSELRQIIKSGRVSVDGRVVTAPEAKVDSEVGTIALDGKSLNVQKFRYYMMDKPAGLKYLLFFFHSYLVKVKTEKIIDLFLVTLESLDLLNKMPIWYCLFIDQICIMMFLKQKEIAVLLKLL